MRWLGVVIRVGVLWVLSLVIAFAGLELGHRLVGVPAEPSQGVSIAARY
jgi:hypothetical protein